MSKNTEDNFAGLPVADPIVAFPPAAACDAQKEQKEQIQSPRLGLVPIPELRVEMRDIDFQMEVGVSEKSKPASDK